MGPLKPKRRIGFLTAILRPSVRGCVWGSSTHSPDAHLACLLGVKIQIQSLNGEHLHIREFHRVKVGDIATGISSQVRGQVHT